MSGNPPAMRRKVLVAPLDWGLGHATRCIPLINALVREQTEVVIAAEGRGEQLLRLEFPELRFLELKGYRVEYGRSRWEMLGKMLWQIPKILECIDEEKEWLAAVMRSEHFDIVIADNRYGLTHPDAHCIFVGHQMIIKTSLGDIVDELLQPFQLDMINKFDECWIPDLPGAINLAGELSHPENLPRIPVSYIGPLSRMKFPQNSGEGDHLLVMISGPEPQRTLFEQQVLEQLTNYKGNVMMVRGLPGDTTLLSIPDHIKVINHLPAAELNDAMSNASLIIARCGYSTIMDVVKLQKKSILVPTEGQTEQEYLSSHLIQHGIALCFEQASLNLMEAIDMAGHFNYYFPPFEEQLLDIAIKQINNKADRIPASDQRE